MFTIRNATIDDLEQLVALEKEWPEDSRATAAELQRRVEKFSQGYFIAEDESGMIASIISYPYYYQPNDLSNFQNWTAVVNNFYLDASLPSHANALYIISGTTKMTSYGSALFEAGVNHVVELAQKMGKDYVIGGALLPGYARYLSKYGAISAADYVFKQSRGRFVDPLIEKYKHLKFYVPDENHVIANYFPNEASLNYSALAVRNLLTERDYVN